MKLNKLFYAGVLAASVLALNTGCAEDYQELNQDPSNVTKTLPDGLMAAAVNAFQPNDYLIWYYMANYYTRWDQMAIPTGGYTESYTEMAESGGQGSQYIATLKYRNKIQQYIDNTGETENDGYLAACGVLTVYLGIFDTDMYGSIPYTEACQYDPSDNSTLTPKYDTVEELYKVWYNELNDYIAKFQESGISSNTKEDVVYGGDWSKWAKLANSLKLKIAVRLYNNDPTTALQYAQEAASNSAGLITDAADDMLFCKATKMNTGDNDIVYGTGNGLASQGLSDKVRTFLLGSKDPRIRFVFTKNDFNSTVVQEFISEGRYDDLPEQVKENVVLDENGNFKEWGGMGEPWVRYTSLPVVMDGAIMDEYHQYFKPGLQYQLSVDETTKSYTHYSYTTSEMRKGRTDYTVPTVGNNVIQDTDDNPLYVMYLGAGEVQLYLAELSLLSGQSLAGHNDEYWYNAGVQASVHEFNALAEYNKIPYYSTTYGYDPNESPIDLRTGEIDAMMATDNVKYTGDKNAKLEKIYLQQLVHFFEQPCDQFVTARRSGYPKIGSSLLPFVKFDNIALSAIPRRFEISEPLITDVMYDIKKAAYAAEGFEHFNSGNSGAVYNTSGNAPLNTERVWQDKNAPQWGSPK